MAYLIEAIQQLINQGHEYLLDPHSLGRQLFFPVTVAGLAAYFGASTAAKLSDRAEKKQSLLEEIRATTIASGTAATIYSDAIAWKKQHIAPLQIAFLKTRNALIVEKKRAVKEIQLVEYNYSKLSPYQLQSSDLFETLRSSVVDARILTQSKALLSSTESFELLLEERNALIDEFKNEPFSEPEQMQRYLGFPMKGGVVDTRYEDTVRNLSISNDDIIAHSLMLSKRLTVISLRLRSRYVRKYGRLDFNFFIANLITDETEPYLPDWTTYAAWLQEPSMGKKPWYISHSKHYQRLEDSVGLNDLRIRAESRRNVK